LLAALHLSTFLETDMNSQSSSRAPNLRADPIALHCGDGRAKPRVLFAFFGVLKRWAAVAALLSVAACGGGGSGGGGDAGGGSGDGNSPPAEHGHFDAIASMSTARDRPSAVLLANGKVLVAGGTDSNGIHVLASAELFDPATRQWSAAASMAKARARGSNDGFLTVLGNGKVLAADVNGAELYDPASNTWTTVPNSPAISHGTRTLLADGRVLSIPDGSAQAYLYDPVASSWTAVPGFDHRSGHAATRLGDGRVLVSGGTPGAQTKLTTALIFDPANGSWTSTGNLNTGRFDHFSFALADGRVVASHGVTASATEAGSTEVFDPAHGTWSLAGNVLKDESAVLGAAGTSLLDGRFMVIGGTIGFSPILDNMPQGLSNETNAEWFDPQALVWQRATPPRTGLVQARAWPVAVTLGNGTVLVAGGNDTDVALASAEIYTP
jgi:hypothetical protein